MRRMVRATGGLLLVTAAAFVLVGCSTDNVSGAQRAAIDQADPICETAQQKIGGVLGDQPAQDAEALRVAAEQLLAVAAPSENLTTWTIFVQSVNNLWLNVFDMAESLQPIVNDRPRAQRALDVAEENNNMVIDAATDYKTEECKNGFAEDGFRLP